MKISKLKPFSRISQDSWIWDNMYCTWRKAKGYTVKEARLCCFTHYANSSHQPKNEPSD